MSSARPAQPDSRKKALEYLWAQFKVWDETSEAHRRSLSLWRPRVLALGVAGGVLGALSTPGALPWVDAWEHWNRPPAWLGALGGVMLGLAAFFTRELLSPEREGRWVRARSVAEAFKREAYLMAASAPPYDGAVTPASLDRAKDILATVGDMQEEAPDDNRKREGMPRCPLPVDEYIASRLDDQVEFYRGKAGRHNVVVRRVRGVTLALGAAAVVIGAAGGSAAVWLAVITAVTTSLTSYLYARRLQYLIVSYYATARNLEALRAGWGTSGKTDADTAERNQFIADCEKILSAENSAWITEWARKDSTGGAGVD